MMELETALAKISLDVTSRRDPNNIYHMMPLPKLEKLTPALDWKQFLTDVGRASDHGVERRPTRTFFKGLNAVLDSTSLDTIKAYLQWQLINGMPSTALPEALDDEHFNFYGKTLRGPARAAPAMEALRAGDRRRAGRSAGPGVCRAGIPAGQQSGHRCRWCTTSKRQWIRTSTRSNWMSPETKVKAKEKLHAIANKIGYPDKWRDYSSLKVVRGRCAGQRACARSSFENAPSAQQDRQARGSRRIRHEPADGECLLQPQHERHQLPGRHSAAAVLRCPKEPDAVNYGHIGAVVGHELTHGFDDQGRQFDGSGNLHDWWTAEDGKKFDAKADCEVKEYGEFTVAGGVHVNGKLTLGENTADNGGIRLAYMALLADAKRKNIDLKQKTGRLHAGAAVLSRLRAELVRRNCVPKQATMQVQTNPHSPDAVSGERGGAEHAGVRTGVRLQSRPADATQRRLPCLVEAVKGSRGRKHIASASSLYLSVFWVSVARRASSSDCLIKEVGHHVVGFNGLGQLGVIPEGVRQRVEHHQLRVDSGVQKRPVQVGRTAQQQVAPAGDEERRRHPVQVGIDGAKAPDLWDRWSRCSTDRALPVRADRDGLKARAAHTSPSNRRRGQSRPCR